MSTQNQRAQDVTLLFRHADRPGDTSAVPWRVSMSSSATGIGPCCRRPARRGAGSGVWV